MGQKSGYKRFLHTAQFFSKPRAVLQIQSISVKRKVEKNSAIKWSCSPSPCYFPFNYFVLVAIYYLCESTTQTKRHLDLICKITTPKKDINFDFHFKHQDFQSQQLKSLQEQRLSKILGMAPRFLPLLSSPRSSQMFPLERELYRNPSQCRSILQQELVSRAMVLFCIS